MSITPTSAIAAPNSSGCWVRLAPTSRPPLERPLIPIRSRRVQPDVASQRAQAAKSSNTFCLFASRPASCQRLAVLGAAAQRGHGEQPAALHPGQPLGLERRGRWRSGSRRSRTAASARRRSGRCRAASSGTAAPACRRPRRRTPARSRSRPGPRRACAAPTSADRRRRPPTRRGPCRRDGRSEGRGRARVVARRPASSTTVPIPGSATSTRRAARRARRGRAGGCASWRNTAARRPPTSARARARPRPRR